MKTAFLQRVQVAGVVNGWSWDEDKGRYRSPCLGGFLGPGSVAT